MSSKKNLIINPKNLPVIPALPPDVPCPTPQEPNPAVAICGECNREVHRVEMFHCQNPRCPLQTRVTC